MKTSGNRWKRSIAAGVLGSVVFAGAAFGAEARMEAQRRINNARSAQAARGRVVEMRPEQTDSWLCENISPFFCSYVPTVTAQPATSTRRGRN